MNVQTDPTRECHCCSGTGKEFDHVQIGASLRAKREERNLTLAVVSDRMGVSVPYVSDLERGRRNWNRDLIQRFEQAIE